MVEFKTRDSRLVEFQGVDGKDLSVSRPVGNLNNHHWSDDSPLLLVVLGRGRIVGQCIRSQDETTSNFLQH